MKRLIPVILLLTSPAFAQTQDAANTENSVYILKKAKPDVSTVKSGDKNSDKLDKLLKEKQKILAPENYKRDGAGGLMMGGTSVGGGVLSSAYEAFCQNQMGVLVDAATQSATYLDQRGSSYQTANATLMQGLVEAAKISSPKVYTYTELSIIRGITIFKNLKADDPTQSPERARFLNSVMVNYFQFIHEYAQALDQDGISPWLNRRENRPKDVAELELRYIEFASAQLRFMNENFIAVKQDPGQPTQIFPRGVSAKDYLSIAEDVTANAIQDIHDSLWRDRYSESTYRLSVLNSKLKQFNQGGSLITAADLMRLTYFESKIIKKDLNK